MESQRQHILCGRMFTRRSNLFQHARSVHGGLRVECPECGEGFNRVSSMRRHTMVKHHHQRVRCEQCGQYFTRRDSIKRHQRYTCRHQQRPDDDVPQPDPASSTSTHKTEQHNSGMMMDLRNALNTRFLCNQFI